MGFESPNELLANDGLVVLISPYIKSRVDVSNFAPEKYYLLSEEEFNEGIVNRIMEKIVTII